MKNLLLLASLVLSTQAVAQRLCIAPFTGPNANAARNQVVTAVCDSADCVAATKATTANKPDWKKAKKEGVQYFITGTVVKKGKKSTLTLQVLDKPGAPRLSKQYPLEKDSLSAKNLAAALEAVRGAMGGGTTEAPPVETKKEPVKETRPIEPTPPPREPEKVVVREPPPETPHVKRRTGDHFLIIDLGSDILVRRFEYTAATTPNLRRYEVTFPLPKAGVELYPLVLTNTEGLARGFGVEAGFGFMPLLKTRRQSDDTVFPTTTMRIDAGLRWKLRFAKDSPFALVPFAGVRLHSFTVNQAADGTRLDGVPNLNYVGLRAGLGVEVYLAEDLITLTAQFAVIPVFNSGEIISQAWFPAGSNLGLDGAAGVGVRVLPMLQLRALFTFTQYGLTFKTTPTDQYQAAGAVDRYIGGNISARLTF